MIKYANYIIILFINIKVLETRENSKNNRGGSTKLLLAHLFIINFKPWYLIKVSKPRYLSYILLFDRQVI